MITEILHITDCPDGGVPAVIDNLLDRPNSAALFLGDLKIKLRNSEKCRVLPLYKRTVNPIKLLQFGVYLKKLITEINPRVVHLHSSYAGFIGACVLAVIRKPVIYSPHASASLIPKPDIKTRLLRRFESVTVNRANIVIACSSDEAQVLRKKKGSRVIVVRNGLPINSDYQRCLSERAPPKNIHYDIIGIGRDCPQKDLAEFSHIADELKAQLPDVNIAWLGANWRNGLSENVSWLGYVEEKSVDAALSNAKIFLATSLYEGMSMAAIKAVAAGCFLVLRDTPGTRALILDGALGEIYSSPSRCVESIRSMLKWKEVERLRERQKRFALERCSVTRQLRMTERLYKVFL